MTPDIGIVDEAGTPLQRPCPHTPRAVLHPCLVLATLTIRDHPTLELLAFLPRAPRSGLTTPLPALQWELLELSDDMTSTPPCKDFRRALGLAEGRPCNLDVLATSICAPPPP